MKSFLAFVLLIIASATHAFAQTNNVFDAARNNDTAYIRHYLIAHQPDTVNNKGYTPLILAVYNGNKEAVTLFLSSGADVNVQDHSGNTALAGACFKGYADMVQLLVEHGADVNLVNYNGASPLIYASTFGHEQIAKYLLEHHADKNIKDRFGKTAKDYALNQELTEIVKMLE